MSASYIINVTPAKYCKEDVTQQTQTQTQTQTQEQRDKRAAIYTKSMKSISTYFGVSEMCSMYLFHRSFRSRRKDMQFLAWTVQLQNALVKASRCVGVNWDEIYFGYEETALKQHGIVINEMPETVFRWSIEDKRIIKIKTETTTSDDNGWTTVSKKKRCVHVKYYIDQIRRSGLLI
jgi:hypothetical protein